MNICKQGKRKQRIRVRSQDSEVVWSCGAALHRLQQLNAAVGHGQHLHTCSYTTLNTHTHTHTPLIEMKVKHSVIVSPLRIYHPHRCREQSGEVYFPRFPGCRDDGFLHMLLHWIHILFNPVFSCQSHNQTHELMNVKEMCLD